MSNPQKVVKEPETLINILSNIHPQSKKNSLRRMIDHGRVLVDGKRATRAKEIISQGAMVEILSRSQGDIQEKKKQGILHDPKILYDDEEIIVVEKPSGLLSVATPKRESDTMFDRVRQWSQSTKRKRVYLVHRLDRETSGCLLFAKSPETRLFLQSQFQKRTIERIYHAVVSGKLPTKSGISTSRIKESKNKLVRLVPSKDKSGKEAITKWQVEREEEIHSLVRIKIETGRRAQIRLHMSELGCPVIGDTRYGLGKSSVNRLCLHASELKFTHPNGPKISVKSIIPDKLFSELNRKSL